MDRVTYVPPTLPSAATAEAARRDEASSRAQTSSAAHRAPVARVGNYSAPLAPQSNAAGSGLGDPLRYSQKTSGHVTDAPLIPTHAHNIPASMPISDPANGVPRSVQDPSAGYLVHIPGRPPVPQPSTGYFVHIPGKPVPKR